MCVILWFLRHQTASIRPHRQQIVYCRGAGSTSSRSASPSRRLANVGIIALVDEATGYQEVRDRVALQEVLKKYITGALYEWAQTFPLSFTSIFSA